METIEVEKTQNILKAKKEIEAKLKIKLSLKGKVATIEAGPAEEFQALQVLEAINLGFTIKEALTIADEDIVFRKLNIKDYTRRKNLYEVRARVIGSQGSTKRVVEEVSNCFVVIKENTVGIIGHYDSIDAATTALKNLIKGSKQSNVYNYLETMNRVERDDDLGIKPKKEEKKE